MNPQKIGIVMVTPIRTTGRRDFIKLDPQVVATYELKVGDVLKWKLEEVHRKKQEETES